MEPSDKSHQAKRLSPILVRVQPGGHSKKQYTIITPRQATISCQLSILVREHPQELFTKLEAADRNAMGDFREPNVILVAPTPAYTLS